MDAAGHQERRVFPCWAQESGSPDSTGFPGSTWKRVAVLVVGLSVVVPFLVRHRHPMSLRARPSMDPRFPPG